MSDAPDAVAKRLRLAALRKTGLLDAQPTEEFDRITRLGAAILKVPASFISLADEHRDFYLSHCGFGEPLASERELTGTTFCQFTIAGTVPLVIPDTRADPRYAHVPTIETLGVAAYLGVPLQLHSGVVIGSFCAIDVVPHQWTDAEVTACADLASLVISQIEMRRRVAIELADGVRRHALLESARDGIYDLDVMGRCTFINPAGAAILGYSTEELLGSPIHDLIHHSHSDLRSYPEADCPICQCTVRGISARVDSVVFWRKDGKAIPVEYSCAPIVIEGELMGAAVSFRDIGEKQRAEEALRASERKYRELFMELPIGLFRLSFEGNFLDVNPAQLAILGIPDLPSLQETPVEDIYVNPSDRAAWKREADEQGSITEREVQLKQRSGKKVWVRLSVRAVRGANGTIALYEGTTRDITVEKEAELALEASLATTRDLLAAAPDAFVATDDTGHIIHWNEAAVRTFGWSETEALGRNLMETIIPPQYHQAHLAGMRRFSTTRESRILGKRLELTAMHRSGREFPVELTITAIQRERLIFTSFLRDISERLRLAEHVRQSQKMEAMGSLAGGIAHDFNNLLTVIRVNAEWLKEGLPAEVKPDLDEVVKATDRAAALTQQLLAYSRKQFLAPQPTNLNTVIGSIETMLRRLIPEDVEIVVRLDPALHTVSVDRGQIEQVITNLVINARDAARASPRVVIETRNAAAPAERTDETLSALGAAVVLSVSDNGEGMSADVRERAFEPFFTTKAEGQGTGLGLSMVYGIVKQSGGEIRLETELGRGTTVEMYFPVVSSPPESESGASVQPLAHGSETILLVEDQPAVRKVARRLLEGLGYLVHEATDGEDALQKLADLPQGIDLLITDLVMPRMGGRELARQLQERRPGTKVLFISGYSSDEADTMSLNPSENLLLQKPFTREALAKAVHVALHREDLTG